MPDLRNYIRRDRPRMGTPEEQTVERDTEEIISAVIMGLMVLLLPPVSVWMMCGCGGQLVLNIFLCFIFFFPAQIHALYLMIVYYRDSGRCDHFLEHGWVDNRRDPNQPVGSSQGQAQTGSTPEMQTGGTPQYGTQQPQQQQEGFVPYQTNAGDVPQINGGGVEQPAKVWTGDQKSGVVNGNH